MVNLYKQDGVDLDLEDAFSEYAASISRETSNISPFVRVRDHSQGRFRGPRGFTLENLPIGCELTGAVDGIGTKVILIDAAQNHETASSNLIAMTAMDITRYGGLSLVFYNLFDVSTLGQSVDSETFRRCQLIMRGLGDLCLEHEYVMMNGDTAELGVGVGSENPEALVKLNWGGFMLGAFLESKLIYGNTLKPGQVIMALKDDFRSNGISSVIKALKLKYGDSWWNNPEAHEDIVSSASPAKQYDRFLNGIHGWFNSPSYQPIIEMHLIIHLSGGAFKSKLRDDFLAPLNLSAVFNDLFEPPEIMKRCARYRGMSAEDCYKTWNGGQGALVVIAREDVRYFEVLAADCGLEAKAAGEITEKRDYCVKIISKFGGNEEIYY